MKKPIVHYVFPIGEIVVGQSAMVYPVDHTSTLVTNKQHAITSPVIRVGAYGVFETLNTIYKPAKGHSPKGDN